MDLYRLDELEAAKLDDEDDIEHLRALERGLSWVKNLSAPKLRALPQLSKPVREFVEQDDKGLRRLLGDEDEYEDEDEDEDEAAAAAGAGAAGAGAAAAATTNRELKALVGDIRSNAKWLMCSTADEVARLSDTELLEDVGRYFSRYKKTY